ncbi:endo alpha-1,4 polygalactosaminidase [Burkholderia gladioli]|uniref:endo alpha-1,4 polygalactosaminidase n=1 Tax=Burkholderia gladioli TaxID=28095 RepID=UPI0016414F4F|nr:endo alpha-1,4 polygalactosaminidase [Burkholderia gladioli]
MKHAYKWFGAALALVGASALQACGGDSAAAPSPSIGMARVSSEPAPPAALSSRWQPVASDTWQWQLRGKLNRGYAVAIYDIDLFDNSAQTIADLHQAGRKVVCYFSAGSSEDWRPDFGQFAPTDKGKVVKRSPDSDWEGENWLDTRSANVRAIMTARLDRAVAKGCDGVEPDNVDAYANDSGFPLTPADQADFNRFIAAEAHRRNLAVGLKNDVDQIALLAPSFDFAVNEECHEQGECDKYGPFTSANKPVLNAEYEASYRTSAGQRALCADARARKLRTLVLSMDLDDSYRFSCD